MFLTQTYINNKKIMVMTIVARRGGTLHVLSRRNSESKEKRIQFGGFSPIPRSPIPPLH